MANFLYNYFSEVKVFSCVDCNNMTLKCNKLIFKIKNAIKSRNIVKSFFEYK